MRATVQQIWDLEAAGCEIVRCAVPVREARCSWAISKENPHPVGRRHSLQLQAGADRHRAGVDGLRLNPGNIGARKYVEEVVQVPPPSARSRFASASTPARWKKICCKNTTDRPLKAWSKVACAISHILEDVGYHEIKISLKASDPLMMIEAYRIARRTGRVSFPSGRHRGGNAVRSARSSPPSVWAPCSPKVSATRFGFRWPPIRWKKCASAGKFSSRSRLKKEGLTFVACPSCGRADVDLVGLGESRRRTNAAL